jgi:hypothetical protein
MKKNYREFNNPKIKNIFDSFDPLIREKLLSIRNLIFTTASNIDAVGDVTETLKWGEPSFAPLKRKVGSPIRLNQLKDKNKFALYFNCQTNLIPTFKQLYPSTFNFEGNRSIVFDKKDKIPIKELEHCISIALTYHINKSFNPTK